MDGQNRESQSVWTSWQEDETDDGYRCNVYVCEGRAMPNTDLVTSDVAPEGQDGRPEGPPNPGWGSLYP